MNILITGGAGFIGSQLAHHLVQKGYNVTLLDDMSFGHKDHILVNGNPIAPLIVEDVRSPNIVNIMKGMDYVYHFAAIGTLPVCQENPQYAYDVNVAGTANVLESARLNKIKRVIFSSTSAMYENAKTYPVVEDNYDEINPDLTYSVSKYLAEQVCKTYNTLYGLDISIIRYFNVYGPHQDFKRKSPPLINYVIRELAKNNPPTLHSNGEQKRDYIFVDDVNELNELCMLHKKASGEIFNACSGESFSVNEIYSIISDILNTTIKAKFNPSSKFWQKYENLEKGLKFPESRIEKEVNKFSLGSNSKAKELLEWQPKTSMTEGLSKCISYIQQKISEDSNE